MGSFTAQFCALCRKNWIILWRHRWINLLRCLILPVAYAAFFAKAQDFFTTRANLGRGHIAPLLSIPPTFLDHKFVWSLPPAAASNVTIADFTNELMRNVLEGVSGDVLQVDNENEVEKNCPQNFNSLSECFAAVVFNRIDPSSNTLNYTLRGDLGLAQVDVEDAGHDDVQRRFLPLQWAIDSNFVRMTTGTTPPNPLNWEFTNETNDERSTSNRLSYLRGIRSLIVLAHFLVFLGVVYQLPGSMASERAASLTAHLEAMGCRKAARVISWHLSISSAYLPAWIIVAVIFKLFVYKGTNAGLFIIFYILTGLSLASWTHLIAVPFANAPTLAAITSTFLAIILAIGALLAPSGTGVQIILTLVFPPMFYTFVTKGLSAWETLPAHPDILRRSPRRDAPILALLIVAIIDIFVFPLIATWLENKIYGVPAPNHVGWFRSNVLRKKRADIKELPEDTAVELDHIRKEYSTKTFGIFGRGKPVVAIEDLSLSIPNGKIFVTLGRNGAAKSTSLSAIARLISVTSGDIRYADDLHIGIASQKDVLWDELTCKQHIALWRAIKNTPAHRQGEPDLDLLARCDLLPKVDFLSKNLSGGQKRKLQLACALAGGSNLLLLDEISSGLDPLSRRAIWKLITENRGRTTIVLTTHFLDEADYLGDQVAILQAPGRLLALDSPVALKHRLGKGFTMTIDPSPSITSQAIEDMAKQYNLTVRNERDKYSLSTGSSDPGPIRRLVERFQNERALGRDVRYQINSATLEEIFLDLNAEESDTRPNSSAGEPIVLVPAVINGDIIPAPRKTSEELNADPSEKDLEAPTPFPPQTHALVLTPGHKPSFLFSIPVDAFTIFRKRLIVLRTSWLLPLIAIVMVIAATSIPLFFIANRSQSCALLTRERRLQHLTYPRSLFPFAYSPLLIAPDTALGNFTLNSGYVRELADNQTFVNTISNEQSNITFGGISLATDPTAPSLFAWEGSSLTQKGVSSLNLLSNALLDRISPPSGTGVDAYFRINLDFRFLPSPSFLSTAQAMKWIAFFGLGVAVWPAFAVIYPTLERATNVRSNQYSNGASPVSLWLGHLIFELPGIVLVSTVITIIFGVATTQFNGPGYLWLCFVLYGIAATLWSYLFALFLNSPLAAWALVAGINVIVFLLYLASYLLILTYDRSSAAARHMTISHFSIAIVTPVPNIMRAALVSVNLFGLLCDGLGNNTSAPFSSIKQFGGSILYLIIQAVLAFALLVYVDSGSPIPSFLRRRRHAKTSVRGDDKDIMDVLEEQERVARDRDYTKELLVNRLRKRFTGSKSFAVDDVSFGVGSGETFALIGPNGAGKSTTLACIRGVEVPTGGDVNVVGHSIVKARNAARSYLGVCPQVNAIDPALTVRQHLWLYGRLKGVPSKPLRNDIESLLHHAGLLPKANQLATSLSGGNQRKLSLAMALIGDRPVVLIDEFSSGVDPFSKREAWVTLAGLTKDRAVVMTTHSMEEVDALATRVGIIASKMLAVGTPASLKSRFATYEIHIPASSVEPLLAILHEKGFENSHKSMDTSTRVSVPGIRERELGRLLGVVEGAKSQLGDVEMTLHEASTETAFLEIVRSHNVREEEGRQRAKRSFWQRLRGKEAS